MRWPSVGYWFRVTLVVGLTLAGLALAWAVAKVLLLAVVALILAAGLDPVATRLERAGLTRTQAVAVLFGTGFALVVVFVALVTPAIAGQLEGLSQDIPRYVARLQAQGGWLGEALRDTDAVAAVQDVIAHLPQRIGESFGTVLGVAGRVGAAIIGVLTVAILTAYLVASFPRLRRTAPILVPTGARARAEVIVDRAVERVGAFVAGNAVTSLVCGTASVIALFALGVPFAVPLGIFAGVADLIPILGPFIGAAPAVVVAFFVSPLTGVLTIAYFLVYQRWRTTCSCRA